MKFAVIKTGGKQYLVSENEEIYVDRLKKEVGQEIELETLAVWDSEKEKFNLGTPNLKSKVKGKIIENLKGEKIRVAKFKAKARYRRVKGFRPYLSKIKIIKI